MTRKICNRCGVRLDARGFLRGACAAASHPLFSVGPESQQQRMRGGGSSGGTSGSGCRDRTLLESSLLGTSRGIWRVKTGNSAVHRSDWWRSEFEMGRWVSVSQQQKCVSETNEGNPALKLSAFTAPSGATRIQKLIDKVQLRVGEASSCGGTEPPERETSSRSLRCHHRQRPSAAATSDDDSVEEEFLLIQTQTGPTFTGLLSTSGPLKSVGMAAQKINEAHEHIAKAEKCLKTSLTKWKPDFDSAASEYAKAAVCFKNAKQYEQAKDAYLKEAEYHTENKTAIEQAGMMMKEQKKMPEAIQYIEKACMMYMENGTPDTAAMALDRAGKLIEPINLEKAVDLYQKAAGVFENEDRLRQAVELLGKASRLLVRLKRLDEAAVALQKEKNMYKEIENFPMCFKKTTAQVLVHLHRGDYVAADKCVRESYRYGNAPPPSLTSNFTIISEGTGYIKRCVSASLPGYSGSEDCVAMETLLQGYDEQDEDQAYRVCNSPLLKYMDNDYAKLAISLKVPGGGGKKKKAASAPQGGAGGAPSATKDEEDDEYEG
ncbi:hypothetical protein CCH79_00009667, partial [Gambusia affinis]